MMYGPEKSDSVIVATKLANKAGEPAAEQVERRTGTKGSMGRPHTRRTQSRDSVPQGLERVRQAVRMDREERSFSRGPVRLAVNTQGRSRVRELRTLGSVRGAPSNGRPYRERVRAPAAAVTQTRQLPLD